MRRAVYAYNGWLRKQYDEKRDLALAMEYGKGVRNKDREDALIAVSLSSGESRSEAETRAHMMCLVPAR